MSAIFALLQVHVPGVNEHRVTDMFKPMASPAAAEKSIALLSFAITGAIFVVVAGLIVYTIYRFRRRPEDKSTEEPPQIYGSNQIEVAWTVIPILIAFILIGVSARVIASVQNASPKKATLKVTVIGHQWWWEVYYPDYNIRTANEIHVPSAPDGSVETYFTLESADVIHSFWVPQLSGKTDVIPNRDNFMWIDPHEPGDYLGNCAEYCGTQHANMLLRVVVQNQSDFDKWAGEQQKPQQIAAGMQSNKKAFESYACVNCHAIRGTIAEGKVGPDLTHFAGRRTLAAGILLNNHKNLRDWINDPQEAKPGCLMPSMKLTDSELNQVTAYLESLQ